MESSQVLNKSTFFVCLFCDERPEREENSTDQASLIPAKGSCFLD